MDCDMHKLVFQGFLVLDWEGIDRLCEPQQARGFDYRYCIAQSVNAGMDMVNIFLLFTWYTSCSYCFICTV
jgi:hypothetical protein